MSGPICRLACVMAIVIPGLGWAQSSPSNDPLTKTALKVTGVGKVAESKRGTPQGRLMAERAAEMDAKRNLALAIGKVSIEGTDRDKEIFVNAFVRGARVTAKKQNPDGSVEVTMELPLSEIARNFAEMQRLAIRAEENRQKLEEVFKRNESDLRTVKERLEALQESIKRVEEQIKSVAGD